MTKSRIALKTEMNLASILATAIKKIDGSVNELLNDSKLLDSLKKMEISDALEDIESSIMSKTHKFDCTGYSKAVSHAAMVILNDITIDE
jgi:hypothetical protein